MYLHCSSGVYKDPGSVFSCSWNFSGSMWFTRFNRQLFPSLHKANFGKISCQYIDAHSMPVNLQCCLVASPSQRKTQSSLRVSAYELSLLSHSLKASTEHGEKVNGLSRSASGRIPGSDAMMNCETLLQLFPSPSWYAPRLGMNTTAVQIPDSDLFRT